VGLGEGVGLGLGLAHPTSSVTTATIGSAVRVTTDPSSDTVCPVQSFRKSEWRHSERSVTSTIGAACHT